MASLGLVWQVLFKGYQELQIGNHLFQHGEMIIIRLIYLYEGPSPDDLIKNLVLKKNKNDDFLTQSNTSSTNKSQNSTINKSSDIIDLKNLKTTKDNLRGAISVKSFRHFVDLFYKKREGMLHTYLYNKVKLISFNEGEIIINTKSIIDPNFIRTITKLASTWTGRIWQINLSESNIGQTLNEEDFIEQQKEIDRMKNDPEVKNILDNFPGIKIHTITKIDETTEERKSTFEIQKIKEK